jgi:hypothetical protein
MAYKRILFVVMLSAALAALDEEGRDSEYMAEHDVADPNYKQVNEGEGKEEEEEEAPGAKRRKKKKRTNRRGSTTILASLATTGASTSISKTLIPIRMVLWTLTR